MTNKIVLQFGDAANSSLVHFWNSIVLHHEAACTIIVYRPSKLPCVMVWTTLSTLLPCLLLNRFAFSPSPLIFYLLSRGKNAYRWQRFSRSKGVVQRSTLIKSLSIRRQADGKVIPTPTFSPDPFIQLKFHRTEEYWTRRRSTWVSRKQTLKTPSIRPWTHCDTLSSSATYLAE